MDGDTLLESFCDGQPIWDYDLMWNTSTPRFSRCFQKTLPIWLPSLFLWAFAPLEAYMTLRVNCRLPGSPVRPIPVNAYNVGRLLIVGLIVLVNGAQFAYDLKYFLAPDLAAHPINVTMADLTSSLLSVFTFSLFALLVHLHRKHGQHTSGLAWLFTFLVMLCALPVVYMYVRFYGEDSSSLAAAGAAAPAVVDSLLPAAAATIAGGKAGGSTMELLTYSTHFGLCLALFLLTCFADKRPSTLGRRLSSEGGGGGKPLSASEGVDAFLINGSAVELKSVTAISNGSSSLQRPTTKTAGEEVKPLFEKQKLSKDGVELKECPELEASYLSQLTYHWFNRLAITGFRKSLTLDDLWRLSPEFMTSSIAPIFDAAWLRQIKMVPVAVPVAVTEGGGSPPQTPKDGDEVMFVQAAGSRPGIVRSLMAVFGCYFFMGALFKVLQDVLQFANPLLLKVFIGFIGKPVASEPLWHGLFIAVGFFVVNCLQSVLLNQYFHVMFSIGMRVRSSLISAIYRKALSLSTDARRETTTGEIVNLMSVDAQRFVDLMPFVNLIWSCPLQIALTLYFLWAELGPSVLAGLTVMVCMIPLNGWISAYQRRLQIKQMKKKDERVKVVSEILGGMRVIKLYGWEVPFINRVNGIRDLEIDMLKNISYVGAVTSFIWTTAPFLVSFVTFAIFVLISDENVLDAKKAFVSMALFNLLRFPLTMLPQMITSMVMASVSVKRLNKFLNSSQLNAYVGREEDPADAIVIEGGKFAWEGPEAAERRKKEEAEKEAEESKKKKKGDTTTTATTERTIEEDEEGSGLLQANGTVPPPAAAAVAPSSDQNGNATNGNTGAKNGGTSKATTTASPITLSGINLKVPRGSLVGVVGAVGSGKSSLLSAILGDMERLEGRVNVAAGESVAYVSQQAWIRNATLRENILFGAPYEEGRYQAVVEMCALKPDLAILPGGDQVEIGEKGINLSGGQKQRVATARACYQAASVVLLDDPLSAVDSHVAKHIFEQVLSSKTGYLRGRTRVLVTNNIQLLPEVDSIVVMAGGTISETGTYGALMASGDSKFAEFVREHASKEKAEEQSTDPTDLSTTTVSEEGNSGGGLARQTSVKSAGDGGGKSPHSHSQLSTSLSRQKSVVEEAKKLIEAERAETGNVRWSVYAKYFRSLTFLWLGVMSTGFVAMQATSVASNVWLAVWANDHSGENSIGRREVVNGTVAAFTEEELSTRNMRLAVYGVLGGLQAMFVFFGAIAMAKGTVNSSRTLHRSLLFRIMRSPMAFFDTTPLGRIMNRFSSDISTIDSTIPHTIRGWLLCFLQVLSSFLLIGFEVPVFLLVAVPILVVYYFIQKFYVATSRQLKRLESVTRSPIYSHFGETLSGVHTIRAYGATRRFIADSNRIVDTNQRCNYSTVIANRWLALRLELCGNLIILFSALFAVTSREAFQAQPGFIGLVMTYSLSVTQTLNWLVRMTSEIETNVVSVERIGEYCENVTEKEWTREVNEDPVVPAGWPAAGAVDFEQYALRYREGLSLVLDGVTLHVAPGEKVGICGRTGAGKSSLTLALFRILEPAAGRITIDGVDITRIGLHELRSKLSIIPQDPVLFSGTIRSNLDPFGVYSDEALWKALEHCHLKAYVASMDAGLDYVVAENGENLSVGQRALICLGRALLRKTKILVLDEATAAIDYETDALIQATIRSEFADCTVLTIAHRLNTILDADKILVLDQGRVAEFDSPSALLADRRSKFYSLAKDARLV